MSSLCLAPDAQRAALDRLLTRLADEPVEVDGLLVWERHSNYHRLPTDLRVEVQRRARRNMEAMTEYTE